MIGIAVANSPPALLHICTIKKANTIEGLPKVIVRMVPKNK
jgi:hypothetical protein